MKQECRSTVSVRRTQGQDRERPQRAGVRRATSESLRWLIPGRTAARYSFTGTLSRRQDSTTEMIAATFKCSLFMSRTLSAA